MRWDRLFADFEAQLAAAAAAELAAEVAERVRDERADVTLVDRLRAATGRTVAVRLSDGSSLAGELEEAGRDWLLVAAHGHEHLVPLGALETVEGLGAAVAPPPGAVAARLGIAHALRALARGRVPVQVRTANAVHGGRLARVGSDHCDLTAPRGDVALPFGAIVVVRSSAP